MMPARLLSATRYACIYFNGKCNCKDKIMPKEWSLFRKVLTVVFVIALPFLGSLDSF